MNTDVTTKSIAEKISTKIIPITLIGVGFLVAFAAAVFLLNPKTNTIQTTPVITFVTPTPAANSTISASVTIGYQVTSLGVDQRVRFFINSLDNRNTCSLLYPALELRYGSIAVPLPVMNTVQMADGIGTVCAFVTGKSDNNGVSGTFITRHFTISNPLDTTPPLITSFPFTPPNSPFGPAERYLNTIATDSGGIYVIEYLGYDVNQPPLPGYVPFTPIPQCFYISNCLQEWKFQDGMNTLIVRVIDMHGNYSDSAPFTFNVDATPPTARWTNPNDYPYYVSGVYPLRIDAQDNHGVQSVTVRRSDSGQIIGADSTAPYEIPWNTFGLANGQYALEAIVTDIGFNDAIEQITIHVDNTPPTVAWISPSNGSTITGAVPLLSSGTDPDYVAMTAEYFVDNVLIGRSSLSIIPFPLQWNSASVANGNHVLKVVVTNAAGLTAQAILTVTTSNSSGGGGNSPIEIQ